MNEIVNIIDRRASVGRPVQSERNTNYTCTIEVITFLYFTYSNRRSFPCFRLFSPSLFLSLQKLIYILPSFFFGHQFLLVHSINRSASFTASKLSTLLYCPFNDSFRNFIVKRIRKKQVFFFHLDYVTFFVILYFSYCFTVA